MPNRTANCLLDRLRRRTAWFFVLWFAVGLQPCAVAALSELECPHCPDEMTAPSANAHAHHAQSEDISGHAHAADGALEDCDSGPSDCCETDTAAVDGRSQPPAPKDMGDTAELALVFLPSVIAYSPAFEARPDPPHVTRPATGPRLHLIHCVYLD
ncbi:MAG: hypothetical protein AAGE85_04835 [Pseudomonadota bacterium]